VQERPGYFEGALDVQIDGRVQRVRLAPEAENVFRFALPQAPQLVHIDHGGHWLKELRFPKPADELLHQLRTDRDTAGRQWAMTELVALHKAEATSDALRQQIRAGLLGVIADKSHYWRLRFNALNQLNGLLAPPSPKQAVVLDAATEQVLQGVIREEGAWLRTAAIRTLGLTRDARHADLYQGYLAYPAEPSDRVVNAAAVALGRSGSPKAYDALVALPARPSWKNQSLISALNGLRELGDPRGAELALKSFNDLTSARWTLATPVWDYRLAAADTLVALGRAEAGFAAVRERFDKALAEGHVNDIFANVQLMVALGDARTQTVFAPLRTRFAAQANALKAIDQFEAQLADKLKKP
jgi:aminopeptidase N